MWVIHPKVVLAATFTVANDSGAGSLRQVILDTNAGPGLDTIAFDIPDVGPHSIQPTSTLPIVADPVMLGGYTQTGATPNSNGWGC